MANGGVGGSLSAASDVNLSSPLNGELLRRSGAYWANASFTKTDIGLGNVNNTSDMDKPVSTAQADAIANAGGGAVGMANLPAGSTIRVMSPSVNRPTARTDISVVWIGHASAPANAIQGDLWLEPAA